MNYFYKYLLQSVPKLQKEINTVLSDWHDVVNKQAPSLNKINELFIESFHGGKFIRGTLVQLGYDLFSDKKNKDIIKVAIAFELLHTSLLIHDDIIDQSSSRRGKPSLHTHFKNSHYGLSQAICFGDIGFFLSIKLLTKTQLTSHFSQIVIETILGEMLAVKLAFEKQKNESEIMTMQTLKTAYYTLSGPLTTGAMLANASKQKIKSLRQFGEHVGLAYQIQDDILGIFGDEKITGKSTSNDIEENKNTLLISYALKKATPIQKKILVKYYGQKYITHKQQQAIKQIFIDTGSLAYSQNMINKHNEQAKRFISSITTSSLYQTYLYDLIDFLSSRKK